MAGPAHGGSLPRARSHITPRGELSRKTGLLFDPYFSATKIAWILDRVPGAREAAKAGHIAFGTIDCFLLWRLTGGRLHATDATNASRTALYDIRRGRWDEALCEMFHVPAACLPEVRDSAGDFGTIDQSVLGAELPIRGVAGDQQAALIGQACFSAGEVKSTYGTGAFLVLNTARQLVASKNRLLGTIAYRLKGEVTYALEGSILSAGTAIQWLRDGLGLIARAEEVEALAAIGERQRRCLRGARIHRTRRSLLGSRTRAARIVGLTRASNRGEIARAALDAVVYQTLRFARGNGGGRPASRDAQDRRRHGDERLVHAAARRRARRADPEAEDRRVDGVRRRLSGGARLRHVRLAGGYRAIGASPTRAASRRPTPSGRRTSPAGARALEARAKLAPPVGRAGLAERRVFAPVLAKLRAISWPMPLAAPVSSATWPSRRKS